MVQAVSSFSPSDNTAALAALAQMAQTPVSPVSPVEASPYSGIGSLPTPPAQDEFTSSSTPDASATGSGLPQPASTPLSSPTEPTPSPLSDLPAGFKTVNPAASAAITAVGGFAASQLVFAVVQGAKDIMAKQWTLGKAFKNLGTAWPIGLALAGGLGIADFVVQKKQASNLKSVVGGADMPTPTPTPTPTASPLPPAGQSAAQPA